jgi:hypothetical protein
MPHSVQLLSYGTEDEGFRISIMCQETHSSVLQIVQMALGTIRPLETVCRVTARKESCRSVKLKLLVIKCMEIYLHYHP